MKLHQRSQLDDIRAQLKSAPASLHSNRFRDFHGPSKENARISKNTNVSPSRANITSRPKSQAYKAMAEASATPYRWQDTWMKKSIAPDVKADIWSGAVTARGPLYSLSCNSQAHNNDVSPRSPRMPSKLDALRKQMASAPAARPGPGNLHSLCYDYLYTKEGSYNPPKLDERALRLIDKKLEAADTLGPCYYGQGTRRDRSRVRSLPSANFEFSAKQDVSTTRRSHHHRRTSCNGNLGTTVVGGRGCGMAATNSRLTDNVEEFRPRNYRLRSDIDIRRRKQSSAPAGKHVQDMDFLNSPCDCQARDMSNRMPPKKAVNFKELKDTLKRRCEGMRTNARNSHDLPKKVENVDHLSNSAHQRHCSHKYETASSSPSRRRDPEHDAATDRLYPSNYNTPASPIAANAAAEFKKSPRPADEKCRSCESHRTITEYQYHDLHHPHRHPHPSLCSGAAIEEPPPIRNETLDKSLQRQKMMLRIIRKAKEKMGKSTSLPRLSRRRT